MNEIQFRAAEEGDLMDIISLLANDPLGKLRESEGIPISEAYSKAFEKIKSDSMQELMVAVSAQDEIIGTFQLSFIQYLTYTGGLRAQIEAVRIKKGYRGIGLGEKMIRHAIERAKIRKAHVLQLTTDKQRPESLGFYKTLGFNNSHEGLKMHL
ncbi:GNAT family N-acetyltransferase [bacterium]|nr:GNAT family N-acetyltransferase [bacterium]